MLSGQYLIRIDISELTWLNKKWRTIEEGIEVLLISRRGRQVNGDEAILVWVGGVLGLL